MGENGKQPPAQAFWPIPYWYDPFVRGTILVLMSSILACVVARSPQFTIAELNGQKLSFTLDAISLILSAPIALASACWILKRIAEKSNIEKSWDQEDIYTVGAAVGLLSISCVFIWLQFFEVLAPDCRHQLKFRLLLWKFDGPTQVQHCMSTASELNKKAPYYIDAVWFQSWCYTLLTVCSLWLLWRAWQCWVKKARRGSLVASPLEVVGAEDG